jgi:sugar transferase (PEP-CTERM system associated)
VKALYVSLTARSFALAATEGLLIVGTVWLAAWLRLGSDVSMLLSGGTGLLKAALIAGVCQACLYYADMYDLRRMSDRRELFVGIVRALAATSFLLAIVYYWFPALVIGRGVFIIAAFIVIALVVSWRFAFDWVNEQVGPSRRLLVVGTSPACVSLAREIFARRRELGVEIVGFVDADQSKVGTTIINPGVIGTIDDIPSIVRAKGVERVVVSLGDARGKLPMGKLLEMKLEGVSFDHLASVYEELTGKIAVENLRPSWLIFSSGFRKTRLLRAQKRLLDIVVASLGLALMAPVMLLIAIAVRRTSRGPAFYHQQRVGLHGHVFTIHKFRSMREDAEDGTGAVWASKDGDARVTFVGRLLRKTRLDELPQLWNVLVGDMSFVGPRPERPEFVSQLTTQIPFYGQRHAIRPGITGWAQVRYTYGASVEDALEKLQYDLFYFKHVSIAFDLFIIFSTVKTVILRRGA